MPPKKRKATLKKGDDDSLPPPSSSSSSPSSLMFPLWKLPDTVLFHIVCHVAPPTHRAAVICHQLAPLSKAAAATLLMPDENSAAVAAAAAAADDDDRKMPSSTSSSSSSSSSTSIWDIILRQDYGVVPHEDALVAAASFASPSGRSGKRKRQSQQGVSRPPPRRACKRLQRSVLQRVKNAHQLIQDNTEIAFFYLSEMVNSSNHSKKLSRANLRGLLDEYGPVRVNRVVSSGGLFLVEVCRARHVPESTVLQCVTELVQGHGALCDGRTDESPSTRQTAMAVAAARGMPTVVRYLLDRGGASRLARQTSSGRFRLHYSKNNRQKSITCRHATPLQFAQTMYQAETAAGATPRDLTALQMCIRALQAVGAMMAPSTSSPSTGTTTTSRAKSAKKTGTKK